MPRILLVTIAIGERYLAEYNRLFRPSQQAYAARHAYDFKVITDWLSAERDHNCVSFQKILVASQPWSSDYDIIVFVDADIYINPDAPEIPYWTLEGRIGCVNEWFPGRAKFAATRGWETSAADYYALGSKDFVLPATVGNILINTGVLIMQPLLHGDFLEDIYKRHIGGAPGHKRGFHYEQAAIGYELIKAGMYTLIDVRWNALLPLAEGIRETAFRAANYFIHYAGNVKPQLSN